MKAGNVCHFLCLETKKVTKENSRTKEWLRPFVRPTHLWQVRRRSFVLTRWMSEAIDARFRCVIFEDTGGAVFRPGVLKVISGLKNGGIRQTSDRHGAGNGCDYGVASFRSRTNYGKLESFSFADSCRLRECKSRIAGYTVGSCPPEYPYTRSKSVVLFFRNTYKSKKCLHF